MAGGSFDLLEVLGGRGVGTTDQLGFLPLLILPIKAGIKFLRSPKGRQLIAQIRARRQAAVAARQAAAPGSEAARAADVELERLTALENQARAGKVTEADVSTLVPALAAGQAPIVAAPVPVVTPATAAPPVSEDEEAEPVAEDDAIGGTGAGRRLSRLALARLDLDRQAVDGVGGLDFTVQAPPGVGRLIRIPFYLLDPVPGFDALFGQAVATIPAVGGTASAVSPAIRIGAPVGAGVAVTPIAALQSPVLSWATVRVVAFETNVLEPVNYGTVPMAICFARLNIGGGANLFVHENFAPSSIYQMGSDSFCGLRDYPVMKPPNSTAVAVQGIGFSAGLLGEGASAPLLFSSSLVCEILVDDNYGVHVPGPYARPGALLRA